MKLGKDIRLRKVGEDAIILDLASQRYFALDPVASEMVSCLLETDTIQDALEKLIMKYDAPGEVIQSDLEKLQMELLTQGILG